MKDQLEKYAGKITAAGLAAGPLVCGLDDEIVWNRPDERQAVLEQVLKGLQCNSLICAAPAEPYQTILRYLVASRSGQITPRDCETRTFLHDLPVSRSFTADSLRAGMQKRKSVIVAHAGAIQVAAYGTVSPEQAFITFSSVCFSCFVLFFSDYLSRVRAGTATSQEHAVFARAESFLPAPHSASPELMAGPFTAESQVTGAMIEAGRFTVDYGLVDSSFGNLSYLLHDIIYISQTGSSLDELAGCIDPCPLDGSSCAGITASSELAAHRDIYLRTANRAILHGHPKFTVILSMDCDQADCPDRYRCHITCPRQRFIEDIPIVPGEVGTGPTGLCHTLPPAVRNRRGAVVWGHGLFTVGTKDFNEPFSHLLAIENMCREKYFHTVRRSLR